MNPRRGLSAESTTNTRGTAKFPSIAMRARRQNSSCDQCRRSKKACDGYWVNNDGLGFSLGSPDGILPCSYCVKTKKRCSLNMHWVTQGEGSPSSILTDQHVERGSSSEQEGIDNQDDFMSINSIDSSVLLQTSSPNRRAFDWALHVPGLGTGVPADNSLPSWGTQSSLELDLHTEALGESVDSNDYLPQVEEYAPSQPILESDSQGGCFDHNTTISKFPRSYSMATDPGYSVLSAYRRKNSVRKNYRTRRRSNDWSERLGSSFSPSCPSQGPMASFNNNLITESLLRIYSDVLENNLACWLAEDICPYKMRPKRTQVRSFLNATVSMTGDASTTTGWGHVGSNSIYQRVKLLDRVAQSAGLVQLTYTENQAASKALNLVILAFATQWTQGRRRREKMFPTSSDTLDPAWPGDMADDFADEFEQNLQHSLWEQAQKALQDVVALESYRVVYAELIFGLIQRPRLTSDDHMTSISELSKNGSFRDMKTSLPQIMQIISQDGPPVYMERASRKMQALKYHFEANEIGFMRSKYADLRQREDALSNITTEERSTIGLLFWLAVMFDTVSSSMNERPVALADEDCQHDAANSSIAIARPINHRWSLEIFAQDNPKEPSTLSWPCPYDSAIKAVNRSAAVKVLLFRYVSYLQNALRKRERDCVIEEIIRDAMQIYRYWNVTHGAFFRSLIKNYEYVPPRIKSWFPCIHIPWLLGALMLADLIEFIDQNGLGTEDASRDRLSVSLAARIRKSSAVELSDLARVTTPEELGNMPTEQLPGYHFAVNEGSILTEPWTTLLIRAFTKASIFHLSMAEDLRRQEWDLLGQESEEYKGSLRHCKTCIKALWFLGRKSEMARSLSKVLAGVLQSQAPDLTFE